jgi:hypothetical protein
MNTAYKHLETKLKIAEMTLMQWGGIVLGVGIALGWGSYLSPFGTYVTLFSAVYVGGIPVMFSFLASQSDFDLWLHLRCMVRWHRAAERYVPGPGATARGYALLADPVAANGRLHERIPELDFAALWD